MRSGDNRRAKDRVKGTPYVPVRRAPLKPDYSQLRRDHLAALVRQLSAQWLATDRPVDDVGRVNFTWQGDRRRDRDGVRAASKLVLDALVRAGVLLSDKAECVAGPFADFFVDGAPCVIVELWRGRGQLGYLRFELAGRLPDANEMIEAARLEGARRERAAARERWRR